MGTNGPTPAARKPASRGKMIDGFHRASRAGSASAPLQPIAATAVRTPATVTAKPRKPHQAGQHAAAHKQQPAKTLMRSSVKKPVIKSPAVIKAQTRTDILAKIPAQMVQPKLSHSKVDHKRLRRAERIIQSESVSRFSKPSTHMPVVTKLAPVATAKQPVTVLAPATQQERGPVRSNLRTAQNASAAPRTHRPVNVAPMQHAAKPASSDMFEQALREATSHEQVHHRRRRSRNPFAMAASVAAILLLLVGFLGYQNKPYISMRVAASKAGIEAKMPSYSPAGFTFGDLDYTQGNVTLKYLNTADQQQSFAISQKASDWNSQTLLDNFVSSTNKSYQTIERAGRTIYLFGNNTATWVDNGIWYTIDSSSLSSTQMLDVALSI